MSRSGAAPGFEPNTVTLLYRAHHRMSAQVVAGAAAAGFPVRPAHSVVFGQMTDEGRRLTELARGAAMTPQAMGELIDDLERLGLVERRPDPADRRAKLIVLTADGRACLAAGVATIRGIEREITALLGERGHRSLRTMLAKLDVDPAAGD
jgi:DNA-binding MarR family transcriptional regulator